MISKTPRKPPSGSLDRLKFYNSTPGEEPPFAKELGSQ